MIETKEQVIGNSTYQVTQLPAMRALRMQSKLLKLLGPSFAQMLVKSKEDKDDDEVDQCLPLAVSLLVNQLEEKTLENLVLELTQGVRKDGYELKKEIIDLEFAGNLNELFMLLKFILEVNYADFFQEGGIIHELKKEADKKRPPTELKNV